jgi:hypothetical protein
MKSHYEDGMRGKRGRLGKGTNEREDKIGEK